MMKTMDLESLRVVHLPKRTECSIDLSQFDARGFLSRSFLVASCQRFLWVGDETLFENLEVSPNSGFENYVGNNAYLFLLRVATGLESRVVGETDIFGQLKEAWQMSHASDACPRTLREKLSPWIQRLFEDTKEIRSRYLQNLGGASYGSLVRKIIQDSPLQSKGPILLLGAGKIARSVAPFLQDQELWLWNRNPENLLRMKEEILAKSPGAKTLTIDSVDREAKSRAWREAAHVVLCIPADEARDQERMKDWMNNPRRGAVIHLGGFRSECGAWSARPEFHALDQLFDFQKSQDRIRSVQVERARRACEERAKLRSLGTSITLPHGWEDLAAFA